MSTTLRPLPTRSLIGLGRRRYPTLFKLIQSGGGYGASADSYTLLEPLVADIFATGAGACGGSPSAGNAYHGGGGGASGYSRLALPAGAVLSWLAPGPTVNSNLDYAGFAGADATVTVNGVTMTAQGGQISGLGTAARSVATGFQVNRYGGANGEAGEQGIAPSSAAATAGGTAGGFKDMFGDYASGKPSPGIGGNGALIVPGFGMGGSAAGVGNYGGWGGPGRVLIMLWKV